MKENTIILAARVITETEKAYYMDFDGDKRWVPKSQVGLAGEASSPGKMRVSVPKWLYKNLFPNDPEP